MTAEWMRQRQGAKNALEEMTGVLMLATTNAAVDRINEVAHRVRAAQGELGQAWTYATEFNGQMEVAEGDWMMIRKNDRGQRRHTGDDVLNGHRAVVERIDDRGTMSVRWLEDDGDGQVERNAELPAAFVADAVVLGYAMTVHKAEGLTVRGAWTRPDGSAHRGTVLVDPTGADTSGLYVAMSRHKDEVHLFAGLDTLEDVQTAYEKGNPATQARVTERGIEAMEDQLRATATNANDQPVLDQMGLAPEPGVAASTAHIDQTLQRIRDRVEQAARQQAAAEAITEPSVDPGQARRERERHREGPSIHTGRKGPCL
jgi:hypothetical protein